jgi:hypothetical protein
MKRAVVTGMIASFPVGGVAWDYGQYLLGLEELGFEVYYLEDTGGPTYDPSRLLYLDDDCSYGVRFLQGSLSALSPTMADRWHFRAADGTTFGMSEEKTYHLLAGADLFLNVSGGTLMRDEYLACPCKVLIDTDPGWNQFVNYPGWDAQPGWQGTHGYRAHDHYFTYAQRLGCPDCLIPDMGLEWHTTRPPVMLESWQPAGTGRLWTTVMSWNTFRRPVKYKGRAFGTKEKEFEKIEPLPTRHAGLSFELATWGSGVHAERWRQIGWRVEDSHAISVTPDDYRQYIQRSRGELSIAKNLYVATRSGWFSCRSTCYLASSRPVVVQDTGFSEFIPTGRGLFAFDNGVEADAAITEIEANYVLHQQAAREIAAEYFAAPKVIGKMLCRIGLD